MYGQSFVDASCAFIEKLFLCAFDYFIASGGPNGIFRYTTDWGNPCF